MKIDLIFPVRGLSLAPDHAYALYSALSRIVPAFHELHSPLRFAPIDGTTSTDGQLALSPHSCLKVRLPSEMIRIVLPLAGKSLAIGESTIRLGVPATQTLVPAPMLIARLVTFKNADTPDEFLTTARAKLAERGIHAEPQLPIHLTGERAGEPKRRILRIKGVSIVGYSLLVSELNAPDSIALQEQGLGGRTQMGCGFFVPVRGGV